MKPKHTLIGLGLLTAGCAGLFGPDPDPTLELLAYGGEFTKWWPPGDSGQSILVRQRHDDPRGFAGLEVVIEAASLVRRTYRSDDFSSDPAPKFRVPDSGSATVTARMVQGGSVVAELSGGWGLGPKIQWSIVIDRAPYPSGERFNPLEQFGDPECSWFWCAEIWRDPIAEPAANYAGEALWVTLYRHHPDECVDVC